MLLRTSALARFAFLSVVICACGQSRESREAEQLARFPGGQIVQDSEAPPRNDRGLPDCLRLLAPVLGRGVCVSLEVARPDGSHLSPRWGRWTYEYVKTTQTTAPDGKTTTNFTDIEESSLGLEAQGEYSKDMAEEEWTYWHPTGKKRAVGRFTAGKMSGEWKFWLADGSPDAQLSGAYENNVRIGAAPR